MILISFHSGQKQFDLVARTAKDANERTRGVCANHISLTITGDRESFDDSEKLLAVVRECFQHAAPTCCSVSLPGEET